MVPEQPGYLRTARRERCGGRVSPECRRPPPEAALCESQSAIEFLAKRTGRQVFGRITAPVPD